ADPARWNDLRARIKAKGLRNSLLLAIAPTATIASIVGSYESIEPQISNLFKRETLSGEFLQVNRYLVDEIAVDLQEFPGKGFALKQIRNLRLDRLIASDN